MTTCVMFSKKGYEDGNGEWANMDIGTGPYTWGDWSIGNTVELNAFDDYYVEGQPAIKKVEFKVISEDGNRYIEVETGGADICYNLSGVDIAAAEANSDVQLFREYTMDNCYLSFNQREEPFTDVRVRQAIAYALDIDGAWNVCMDGVGQPAKGVLPDNVTDSIAKEDSPYHVDYPVYQYNLEKAKELLAEAGYPDGFTCTMTCDQNQQRLDTAEMVQMQLAEIGITMKIASMERGTFIDNVISGNLEMFGLGWTADTGDPDYALFASFHSSMHGEGGNMSFYTNPEVDRLLDLGRSSTDPEVRKDAYYKVQEIVWNEVPCVFLQCPEDLYAYNSNLKNFATNADGSIKFAQLSWN